MYHDTRNTHEFRQEYSAPGFKKHRICLNIRLKMYHDTRNIHEFRQEYSAPGFKTCRRYSASLDELGSHVNGRLKVKWRKIIACFLIQER